MGWDGFTDRCPLVDVDESVCLGSVKERFASLTQLLSQSSTPTASKYVVPSRHRSRVCLSDTSARPESEKNFLHTLELVSSYDSLKM